MAYAAAIILLLASALIFDRVEGYDGIKRLAWALCCIMLIAIAGLRNGIGGDSFAYREDFVIWYEGQSNALWETIVWQFTKLGYMPLWTALNVSLRAVTDNFYIFQFIEATAVNIAVCYVIRRHCRYGFTALLLYCILGTYFLFSTEVLREGFSIAFGLLAIEAYCSGRKKAYGLLTALAVGFHVSALMLVLLPWLDIRIRRRTIIAAGVTAFAIWTVSSLILMLLAGLSGEGIVGVVLAKINLYTKSAFNFNGFIRFSLTYLLLPMVAAWLTYGSEAEISEERPSAIWIRRMWSLMVVLGIVAASLGGFNRVLNYVIIFQIIVLAELIIRSVRERRQRLVRLAVAAMLIGLNLSTYFIYWPKNEFYQYQFYFPYTSALDRNPNVDYREEAHLESSDHGNIYSDSDL